MAEQKDQLTNIEKQWINKSLQTQRDSLARSLTRELQGSDIYNLRKQEIEQLDRLRLKFT